MNGNFHHVPTSLITKPYFQSSYQLYCGHCMNGCFLPVVLDTIAFALFSFLKDEFFLQLWVKNAPEVHGRVAFWGFCCVDL